MKDSHLHTANSCFEWNRVYLALCCQFLSQLFLILTYKHPQIKQVYTKNETHTGNGTEISKAHLDLLVYLLDWPRGVYVLPQF